MARKQTVSNWIVGFLLLALISALLRKQWLSALACTGWLTVLALCWIAFRLRTKCGVIGRKGGPCARGTRGIFFGCKKDHYWEKPFAWSRYLGVGALMSKIGIEVPALGVSDRPPETLASWSPSPDMRTHGKTMASGGEHNREIITFYCTVVSTIATIVGTFAALAALL